MVLTTKKFSRATVRRAALALCASASLVAGCAASKSEGGASPTASRRPPAQSPQSAQPSPPTPKPKPVTADDLRQLRWIEGAWRGTGDVEKPFYERYRFENDSTLSVESFDDESLSKATETTRFELRGGEFGNPGEGARWAATALDANSVTFEPVAKARNSFRWQRESADSWTATLDYPAQGEKPASRRVYHMERIGK